MTHSATTYFRHLAAQEPPHRLDHDSKKVTWNRTIAASGAEAVRKAPYSRRHLASTDTPVPDNTQPYQHHHDWLPKDHFFAPGEKDLDPRLFDEHDHMHQVVRQHLLSLLHSFWAPRYGDSWQTWARVYLAGSEASHFGGRNSDLDTLIGVDYDRAREMSPALASLSDREIDAKLTDELREGLNDDHRMLPGPDGKETGPWESTFYVNPDSWDIRHIRPYAAYDITQDGWAVPPVEVPDDFGPEKLPEADWDYAEAVAAQIRAIESLPEEKKSALGAALYDFLHGERRKAFSEKGDGLYDIRDVVWKYLDKHPEHLLEKLVEWKKAEGGGRPGEQQDAAA